MSSVYSINKGVGRPIIFKGFQGQYIYYLAASLLALLILFALLHIAGVNTYACMVIILSAGTGLISGISYVSRKYGRHGLMKRRAARRLPAYLWFNSRKLFIQLKKS